MFSSIAKFCHEGRKNDSIATELEGTLLISKSQFPYFMLVAFEAGGPIRSLLLLLIYPLVWVLDISGLDAAALRIMIFISMAGLKMNSIKAIAKTVLPRFFLQDVREDVFRVWSTCGGKKHVITSGPRIMVDTFLREYMDVDCVIATELRTLGEYCLGLTAAPGIMAGAGSLDALQATLGGDTKIDVGLSDGLKDHSFQQLCLENYFIPRGEKPSPLCKRDYPKPLIFHDGRLVMRPAPLDFAAIFLWLPFGFLLAVSRILVGFFPYKFSLLGGAATGMRVRATFPTTCKPHDRQSHTCKPPPFARASNSNACNGTTLGTLYVCSRRTLIDPIIISSVLQRHVPAVTFSISKLSEILSPITTIRLSRDRSKDGETMRALLSQGDLVVCPEGTTCREPYLLRFSPLFAEVADDVVPIAISTNVTMFHGSTVRGHKWLDPFCFLMNPTPLYNLEFLESFPAAMARNEQSIYDITNHVQRLIARALLYECTTFTRRDKYRMLAGNDGVTPTK
ncbi:hypothetical protein MRB53_020547 [Persea americana]|uniref:Uncharacterized protein n=1 Tax=Persea americana TaxID=3435 RepID=A0ACC2L1D3_PERAE|nr:hypothetical protein MRB53_020547 [Persea americana]